MIKPLHDNIVLKKEEKENKTASGIILTDDQTDVSNIGVITAVGPGRTEDGKLVKVSLTVGERVIYKQYAGTKIDFENEEYIILSEADVLAVITGGKK